MVAKKCAFKAERHRDENEMALVPFKFIAVSFVDGDGDDVWGAWGR